MSATYTKLKSGEWGIRVHGFPKVGEAIIVRKKSGEAKREIVRKVLWSGNGVSICAIDSTAPSGYGGPRGGRKACITGGNCSSFGSGRSCGGYDCDGY